MVPTTLRLLEPKPSRQMVTLSSVSQVVPVKFVRPRLVSESGGTAALVTLSVAAA